MTGWSLICSLPTSRPSLSSPTLGITRLRPRLRSGMVCSPTPGMVREDTPRNLRWAPGRHREMTFEEWGRTWLVSPLVSLGLLKHRMALPSCHNRPSTTLRTPRAYQPTAYRTRTRTRTRNLNTPTPNNSRIRTRCSRLWKNSGGLQDLIVTLPSPKAHHQQRVIPCLRRNLPLHSFLRTTRRSPFRTCRPLRSNRKPIPFGVHRNLINIYRHRRHRRHPKSHHISCLRPTNINRPHPWNRGQCWNQ
jgi:hypothetical protein